MAAENAKLRKLERDAIEIGNGAPRFGFAQGARVSDLCAERDVELAALREQRIVPAIVRRAPTPRAERAVP